MPSMVSLPNDPIAAWERKALSNTQVACILSCAQSGNFIRTPENRYYAVIIPGSSKPSWLSQRLAMTDILYQVINTASRTRTQLVPTLKCPAFHAAPQRARPSSEWYSREWLIAREDFPPVLSTTFYEALLLTPGKESIEFNMYVLEVMDPTLNYHVVKTPKAARL